ncbi:MAG: gliding motility-associated C-terminal domain-containing protein [Saprospiraceae bacterium]|nr:gliding motility-associated C-terminal domain-containing protein [Saprospiraceae bacterium]
MLHFRLSLAYCSLLFLAVSRLSAQCPITVNAGEDVYLCAPPTPTQLNGDISGDYLDFIWSPTTGMTGGNTLSPTVTVSQTTNYVLTATAPDYSSNLVDNGDFEAGNSGFTSDYGYSPGNLVPEGLYDVLDNPQDDHPGFAACNDHTSGSGNMMVVNGAGSPNQNVWCETVPVMPNTQYVLSAWVTSVVASSPALLQFNINGIPVGGIFSAPGGTCTWQQFFEIWDSGGNASATICIVNQNTTLGGNDFALDDIVFAPVCTVTDTVKVNVINLTATAAPAVVTLPCEGASVQLSGNGSSTGPNISYEWTTGNGNILSGENTLTPTVNAAGEYTLTVSYEVNGNVVCTKTATVNVILNPNPLAAWVTPPLPLGCGAPTTLLIGNSSQPSFSMYAWTTSDGNIVGSADQKNCTVSQVGTYTLLVTNTNTGCTASTEVTVTITNNVPVANASSNGLITCANDSVPLLGTGSSTGPGITYSWTTISGQIIGHPDSLNTIAGAGGLYILHVTNTSNNCTSNDTITVPANVVPPTVIDSLPSRISCDPNQDTISLLIIIGPPATVLINWTSSNGHIVSGQNTPTPQVDSQGIYIVSVYDPANGCYAYDTLQVLANFSTPEANILPTDTITCQSPSIQLQGNGSSGGANFSIDWTASNGGNIVSGGNTLTPTVNAAGDYLLILRDSVSLCADTAMVSVLADTNVVVAIANAPDTLNCVVNTVSLNADGSTNGGNLTYSWTTTNGNISGGQGTPNPTVNAPGTYQLLLTNLANGCAATDLAVVALNTTPPPISISLPDTLTCAVSSQIIQAQNSSGAGNFIFHWTASSGGNITAGDSTLTPTVNQPGTYTLTATNLGNGCTASASVNVALEAGFPIVSIAAPGPLTCISSSQILNASGSSSGPNFNYIWTTTDGNISIGGNTPSPIVTESGTYTLQITNSSNGCSSSSSIEVLQDTVAPMAVVLSAADTLTCLTSQLELIGIGTGNGTWTSADGSILFTVGFVAQIDAPGMYVFSTTDPNNGCTAVDSVQVFENVQIPGLSVAPPQTLTCLVTTVTLNATATGQNLVFDWQTGNGNILSGQNTAMPIVDAPGNYALTLTDQANGCSRTGGAIVFQNTTPPDIQIAAPATITCDAPSIILQGQNLSLPGNFSYNWTASAGANIVSGANGLTPVVDAAGVVTFACFNNTNGCETTLSVTVLQDINFPTADAGANDTLSCLSNTLTINGSGTGAANLDFNWVASNGGNILSGGNSPTPLIDQPGSYILTVENPVNGCTDTDVVEIFNDDNAPSANAGTAATLTCTLLQTNLNATASTGPAITYNWTVASGGNILLGQNTLTPTVNEPGVYTLVVTNASNGCVASSSVTVPENVMPPVADAGGTATLSCTTNSLSLSAVATGGPASYAWTTTNGNILSGGNTLMPIVNQAGAYTFTATLGSNGCSASDVVTVGIDTLAPGFQIVPPLLLTCTQLSTPLIGAVQQPGAGNFSANWTTINGNIIGGQNTLNTMADAPGVYVLTLQNSLNGCDAQQQVTVNQDTITPTATVAPGTDITCAVQTLSLNGTGSSAGNQFTYNWTASGGGVIVNGGNTLMPTVNSAGAYTLQVNNGVNGCTSTVTTMVGSNTTPPVAAIAQPGMLTCVQNSVNLDGTGSSQGPNFSASWATSAGNIVSGQGTFAVVVNEIGNYILAVLDSQNGCSQTAQILVQENITAPGALILPAPALHCNLPQITLMGSSPTVGVLNYAWTSGVGGNIVAGANSPTPQVDEPGTYTLRITNPANGCSSATTLALTAIPDPVFDPALTLPNCKQRTGTITFGSVTGGQSPFQFSINGGQIFGNQSQFTGLEPESYELVVNDANGCTSAETVTIAAPFLPTLDLTDVVIIEQGDSSLLLPLTNIPPNQIESWEWSPAGGLSCTDCPQPWAKPLRSQYYTVVVVDSNGCQAEDRILVRVNRNRHIYPPTVFSPNEDGENDRFTLYAKGVREIRRLAIFDRWGEEVFVRKNFQPNDESLGWDGTFRGALLGPAVFVWAAEVEYVDGEVEVIYGDVTVVW